MNLVRVIVPLRFRDSHSCLFLIQTYCIISTLYYSPQLDGIWWPGGKIHLGILSLIKILLDCCSHMWPNYFCWAKDCSSPSTLTQKYMGDNKNKTACKSTTTGRHPHMQHDRCQLLMHIKQMQTSRLRQSKLSTYLKFGIKYEGWINVCMWTHSSTFLWKPTPKWDWVVIVF